MALLLSLSAIGNTGRAEVSDHVGPLAEAMPLGTEGAWTTSLANGWVMLSNTTDEDAIIYFRHGADALAGGTRTVKVNVALRGSGQKVSEVGLIFDYKAADSYKAFTLGSDNALSVFVRDKEGLRHAGTSETVKGRGDGSDVLTLEQTPKEARLLANGETVFVLENEAGFSDIQGLIALGAGRFAFDGYDVAQTQPAAPAGDDFPPPAGGEAKEPEPFPPPAKKDEPEVAETPPATTPTTPAGGSTAELSPQERYAASVLLGTTFGILFHELGHALIGELALPATGPEEDVADEFSAFILGAAFEEDNLPNDPQEAQILHDLVRYSALLWYYNGRKMEAEGSVEPWQDEHSPSLTRFRNAFCIIYGGNPQRYDTLADQVEFPPRSRERCKVDYAKRYAAWERILASVARDLGPDSPGNLPADTPGAKVIVTFEEPTSELGKALAPLFRDTGVMVEMAQHLERTFVWPRDFRIVFRDCQEINAWYDPSRAQVTMCYSIIEFFSKIVFQQEGAGSGPQTPPPQQTEPRQPEPKQTEPRQTEPRQPEPKQSEPRTPEPEQPRQPTAADAVAYLTGNWSGTIPSAMGPIQVQVAYTADGNYHSVIQAGPARTDIWGTWTAQPMGQGYLQVTTSPTRWNPQQLCDGYGYCQPQFFYPETFAVQIVDENTARSDSGIFKRSR